MKKLKCNIRVVGNHLYITTKEISPNSDDYYLHRNKIIKNGMSSIYVGYKLIYNCPTSDIISGEKETIIASNDFELKTLYLYLQGNENKGQLYFFINSHGDIVTDKKGCIYLELEEF